MRQPHSFDSSKDVPEALGGRLMLILKFNSFRGGNAPSSASQRWADNKLASCQQLRGEGSPANPLERLKVERHKLRKAGLPFSVSSRGNCVKHKMAFLLLLVGITLPASARQVTLAQLEQLLASAQGKPDADVARQLWDLELTERLSSAQLAHLQVPFPGTKTRQSLLAIADASAFLKLPAVEAPPPAPSLATQRQIMGLVANYVADTIHQLPNFFARQLTTHFEDQPMRRSTVTTAAAFYKPLHAAGTVTTSTVFYRDGREVVDPGPVKVKKSDAPVPGLKTQGVFGPILQIVLIDAAQNKLAWSHWEQSDAAQWAVFAYSVPQENSHYQVTYCCVPEP